MDLTRITTFCFVASYSVALALEVAALAGRRSGRVGEVLGGGRRFATLAFAGAGLFAHAAFLAMRAREQTTPLSSPSDWCLLAALLVAAAYLAMTVSSPRWAWGVFVLPVVLLLIGVAQMTSHEPFAPERASLFWGQVHGWTLLGAAVAVCLGFAAGLMYLLQSWRLKHKLPPKTGLRLPSLEWLEQTNSRCLGLSVWLVAVGFVSGLVLSALRNRGVEGYHLWTDPMVLSLAAMLVWLVVAEVFRFAYPAARRGQKVAYLTVASFGFLVITLASMTMVGPVHGTAEVESPRPPIAILQQDR